VKLSFSNRILIKKKKLFGRFERFPAFWAILDQFPSIQIPANEFFSLDFGPYRLFVLAFYWHISDGLPTNNQHCPLARLGVSKMFPFVYFAAHSKCESQKLSCYTLVQFTCIFKSDKIGHTLTQLLYWLYSDRESCCFRYFKTSASCPANKARIQNNGS
jgi:hypothetical protein